MQKVECSYFLKYPFVAKLYPARVTFSDEFFNLPSYDWVFNAFYPYFQKELRRLKIDGWSNKFDCEDFTKFFKTLAQACHKSSKGTAEGLAVGEISYTKTSGEYHSINIIETEKGLIFLEPQTGESLILTENEKNSINKVYI